MRPDFEELLDLQDYELIATVRDEIFDEIRNLPSEDDLEKIHEIKFYLITASIFEFEVQNGGLCQFLANEGKIHGPMLHTALCAFGAEQHDRILADFCQKNGIDLCNLQELIPETADPYCMIENYQQLRSKYPFEDFDKAFFELDRAYPLERILGTYIRNNISLFLVD